MTTSVIECELGEDAGAARSLLREGAFDGLRDNIRRVATCRGTAVISKHTLSRCKPNQLRCWQTMVGISVC